MSTICLQYKCTDGSDILLSLITEEICTLVIAEAFPEDGGLFCCTASNIYGSVSSTAQLTVTPGASSNEKYDKAIHKNKCASRCVLY